MPCKNDAIKIIIFAKTPLPGLVKTRLIPALGSTGAATLAQRMLINTVAAGLEAIGKQPHLSLELCVAPAIDHPFWKTFSFGDRFTLSDQGRGDLGDRLYRAADRAINNGDSVILMGMDCPAINAALLSDVVREMKNHDAIICPTEDGGYALLAIHQVNRLLFSGIPWSTDKVAELTLDKLAKLGLRVKNFAQLYDIDEAEDLHRVPEHWLAGIEVSGQEK